MVHPGKQKLAIVVLPGPVRNQLDHLGGVADDFIRPHILGMMDDHQAQNGQEDAEEGKGCPDGRPLEEVFEVLHLQIFFPGASSDTSAQFETLERNRAFPDWLLDRWKLNLLELKLNK